MRTGWLLTRDRALDYGLVVCCGCHRAPTHPSGIAPVCEGPQARTPRAA